MSPVETRHLDRASGGAGGLLRAALPSLPLVGRLPGIRKSGGEFAGLAYTRPTVTVDREHVRRYAEVCGFPAKDTVPLTYPHLLAFPLHTAIMTSPDFPWPAIGTVHLENTVVGHRPIHPGEALDVTVTARPGRPHAKGTLVDFVAEVRAGDEPVWESTSTYLRRGRGTEGATGGPVFPSAPAGRLQWRLPADLGRRYAAVSGDHNPIHLYPVTAKALGFPRQIAHGMWSKARCVAAVENRLPDAVRVEVGFRKPLLLPATVAFGVERDEQDPDVLTFGLTRPDGAPHLVGRATPL